MDIKIERFFISQNGNVIIPFEKVKYIVKSDTGSFIDVYMPEERSITLESSNGDSDRFEFEYIQWLRYGR